MLTKIKIYLGLFISAILLVLYYGKSKKSEGKTEVINDLKDVENKQLKTNNKLKDKVKNLTDEEIDKLC